MNRFRLQSQLFCCALVLATGLTGCHSKISAAQTRDAAQNPAIKKDPTINVLKTAWRVGEVQHQFVVSAIADNGPGSLREAIKQANQSPGTSQILFSSDAGLYDKPQTILLESPLPVISDNLIIDGFIDDMLWRKSGVILDGQNSYRIFRTAPSTQVKIKHLTLARGKADKGGAIYAEGELVVESVTFLANKAAASGGALYADNPLTIVFNTTFFQNRAGESGGGIALLSGEGRLTHNTFSENAAHLGGAVFNQAKLNIYNSILANSLSGLDCVSTSGPVQQPEYQNIILTDKGCGEPYSRQAPGLRPLDYYNGPIKTLPIIGKSPAINYAENRFSVDENGQPLKWDQRGNGDPRATAGHADIGAFEAQAQNVLMVDTLEDVDYRWCTRVDNDCSLRAAIMIANRDYRHNRITFAPKLAGQQLQLTSPLPLITADLVIDGEPGISIAANARDPQVFNTVENSIQLQVINIDLQ